MADPFDPKTIVSSAYDHLADWYLTWTQTQPSTREHYTHKLLSLLPPRSPSTTAPSILDLGCGPGLPILPLLHAAGAHVTANDISPAQLQLARTHCPTATFIAGDMTTALSFAPASFDGIVSFFTLFHLPRAELRGMLGKIHAWLRPGGVFVCNLATVDEVEIHGEMMGHGMFWSSFSVAENRRLVEGVEGEWGFEVLEVRVAKAGEEEGREGVLEEGDADYEAEFMWIVARKKGERE